MLTQQLSILSGNSAIPYEISQSRRTMSSDDRDHEMSDAAPAIASSDVADTPQGSSPPSSSATPSNPAPSTSNTTAGNANTAVGSLSISDPEDPFFVHSCNSASFKYKYPQAKPTPDGEDDTVWNRIYTAADSRMYNKHHKSANESRKYRDTGETRTLALRMLVENKEKHYKAVAAALAGGHSYMPKAAQKARSPVTKSDSVSIKKERSEEFFDLAPGAVPMSISEKIKSEGRKRKVPSDTTSSQGTPAPTTSQKLSSPAPKSGSPAPTKMDKPPIPKKKGTAAPLRKPAPKRPKSEAEKAEKSGTPSSSVRQSPVGSPESNDGGEYCLCRGPDDHRMMVFCDGGCEDWYHCSCVNVDEDDARELLDRYICPKCTTNDLKTTWKRICRYINCDNGCRKGARVNEGSKYCSEEHLNMFFEWCYTKLRGDDQPSMGGALNRQEVADLLTSISTVEELHDLGKKPRLAVEERVEADGPVGLQYILPEDRLLIEEIQQKKRVLEAQIEGYKKQKRLLKMINERAKVASQQPSLDVKAICGYDDRLAMNEAEFNAWLESEEGQKAFETDVLGPRTEDTKGIGAHILYPGQVVPGVPKIADALDNICLKPLKKCKHQNWREIHNGDFIAMQLILTEQLNRLTDKEKEIIDDAETREATKDYYADNITIQLF